MSRLDWRAMMRSGLHDLGLRPREFWALTPVELLLMLGLDQREPALGRSRLEQLQAAFPDDPKGMTDGH